MMSVTVTYANTTEKSEFTTNTYTNGDQLSPDTVGLSGGGFVTAYNVHLAGSDFMLVDFYDASYAVLGTYKVPYATNHTVAVGQPTVTQLADGNVLVAWDDDNTTDLNASGIKAALFAPDGALLNNDITLAGPSTGYAQPSITALVGGGFAVSTSWVGGSAGIYIAVYDAAGAVVAGYLPVDIAALQSDSHVTALAGGGFAVTWTDGSGPHDLIQGRVYDATGVAQTAIFNIGTSGDNTQSSVAAMQNGNFAVVYADSGWGEAGTLGNGITLQIFTPGGANVTPGTWIQVDTTGVPDEVAPDVAILANGFILVTWTHPFSSTDNDIYGRIYDASGAPVTVNGDSDEFVVTSTGSNDTASSVAALLGGAYAVSWQDSATFDGSGGQITSTISELTRTVIGDSAADTYVGDALRDSIDGGGGDDRLSGRLGDDTLLGGVGDDKLTGAQGADLLQGGGDHDTLSGGGGNDAVYANTQADIDGSSAGDTINGGGGADSLFGSAGGDVVLGSLGADQIDGRAGDDALNGGSGNDTLTGGLGSDTLTGAADHDVFRYNTVAESTAAHADLITDLTAKDRIDLHLIDANSAKAGNQAFTLVSSFTGHAGQLVVSFHASGPLAGMTTIEADVDGDGAADLTILASGDHHTFSAFAL